MKIGFLFSGQGSQYPGMGKDFYDEYSEAKKVFDTVGESVRDKCFFAPAEQLSLTINTQPCVFTVCMAMYESLKSVVNHEKINSSAFAGHSLGEYSALCAAGALDFPDAFELVSFRAKIMEEASLSQPGAMAAVLGSDAEALISDFPNDGYITVANYNCPGQSVVSGDRQAVEAFAEYCKSLGVRCVVLAVSGAFHSRLMASAERPLADFLKKLNPKFPQNEVYSNVNGGLFTRGDFEDTIAAQVSSPVLFEQIVRNMISSGIDAFIEFAPKKTLTPMVKRIDKQAVAFCISSVAELNETVQTLGLGA